MCFQQVFTQWKRTTASDAILGKAFQSLGAQAEKARSPYEEEVLKNS